MVGRRQAVRDLPQPTKRLSFLEIDPGEPLQKCGIAGGSSFGAKLPVEKTIVTRASMNSASPWIRWGGYGLPMTNGLSAGFAA
jgi:hypothetical protein